jgi:hydroxymethylbilane synthase
LSEAGGKRLFVKELEDALLADEIDLAVHSAKDMSAVLPEGLTVAAVLPREDPRDALVLAEGTKVVDFNGALAHLGEVPTIATSSVRRIAQLSMVLPQARFTAIRGNVDTRLRKLDGGDYEALVLASAGLRRLGLAGRISAAIPTDVCIPAPGQGIVAIEIRESDRATRDAIAPINDEDASTSLAAERAVVTALGGGCQLPLGAIAVHEANSLSVQAIVAWPDGRNAIRRAITGSVDQAEALGSKLAEQLVAAGAAEILSAVRNGVTP